MKVKSLQLGVEDEKPAGFSKIDLENCFCMNKIYINGENLAKKK